LAEVEKFRSINYTFELERKMHIMQTVMLSFVEKIKKLEEKQGIEI
jgi:hypothetical protein